MKKILNSAIFAIAALFAAGCSDNLTEISAPEATAEKIKVEIKGSVPSDDTRTVLGEKDENNIYPVLWQPSGEKLYIVENVTTVCSSDDTYEVSEDSANARFTFELAKKEGSSFRYMAVSPYDAVTRFSAVQPEVTLSIPKEQAPLASSVDPSCVILFGQSEEFESQPSSLDLRLSHVAAYVKMTVKGIPEDEKLLSVTFNATSQSGQMHLTGRYYYNYTTPSKSYATSSAGDNRVIIDAANLDADAEGNYDVWFATMPTNDISILGLEICTDKTVYTNDYDLKPGFKFDRGVVSRFSVTVKGAIEQKISDEYKIFYTTTDGEIVTPANIDDFGDMLTVLSNTYADGKGTIVFNYPVAKIGDSAFKNCKTLKSIEIPERVKAIGISAFTNCEKLESVVIPSGVTEIGYTAFSECWALKEVTIPENVESVNTYAFKNCKSLATVYCKRAKEVEGEGEKRMEITQLGWFAFDGIADNAVIYVPAIAYNDYISNMGWSKYKEKIRPEE